MACVAIGLTTAALLAPEGGPFAGWTVGAPSFVGALAVVPAALPGGDGPTWALPVKRVLLFAAVVALAAVSAASIALGRKGGAEFEATARHSICLVRCRGEVRGTASASWIARRRSSRATA